MNQEKRFSSRPVLEGCFVSWVFMFVLTLAVTLVFTNWLRPPSNETQQLVRLFVWLVAICLGGYYAARRGQPAGWTNSFAVGLLAELFLLARLSKEHDDTAFPSSLGRLFDVINDPATNWRPLVLLALTIPAAILGGIVWEKTCGTPQAGKAQ